jgi:hypothetical protein
MRDGGHGATRPGMIMDTNAPAPDHWWPLMSGEAAPPDHMTAADLLTMRKPEGWAFFTQPPAMLDVLDGDGKVAGYALNPARENGRFTKQEYYKGAISGQKREWIENMVQNKLGRIWTGDAVWPQFNEHVHIGKVIFHPDLPLIIGMDFGLTPSAIFVQSLRGRLIVLDELISSNMGLVRFLGLLRVRLAERFGNAGAVQVVGDPAGDQRAQTDETTPFQVLRANGFPSARPAPPNDVSLRIEAVDGPLTRMVDGLPGFVMHPRCLTLRNALAGGYHYRPGTQNPVKDAYSHPSDALQYAALGAGEGRVTVPSGPPPVPVQTPTRFRPSGPSIRRVPFRAFRK